MSSFSALFIRRPVATTLLTLGLFIAGWLAFRALPISALPEVDYPTIVVRTQLPGASAETIASSVTTPLERQLGQVPSLARMTSLSSYGNSQITLQFELERDIDAAEQDVQAAINAASSLLSPRLPAPPSHSKVNPADPPILTLAVSSNTLPLRKVADYADSVLAQKISQLSGVGLVTLGGGQKPAVRVQVNASALTGSGLSLEDLRAALVAANANLPKGTLDGPRQSYTLKANDQLADADAFASLVISQKQGAPVRLSDVARVVDGVEDEQVAGWANAQRAVILNVQRQPGTNVIEVADRVKALLPAMEAALPAGLSVRVLCDRTATVRASVSEVELTLLITIGLVVGVIFFFLRSARATLIPSVTLPLSLVATFGVMYFLGYGLDNLSLMALTISAGFVVDDAIVMLENVARHIEAGDSPLEAALKGSRQIAFTIVSLTVSLIAVLIPLLFMGGVIGRLFREFAVTLSVAIGVSAILSLTLTPMMCAHLLKPDTPRQQGDALHGSESALPPSTALYGRGLEWVLSHQPLTLFLTLATVAATLLLYLTSPKGFLPVQDTGLLLGVTEAAPDASFARMTHLEGLVTDVLRADPAVESVASFIGADGTNPTSNSGRLSIALKPNRRRADSAELLIQRLEPALAQIPGILVHLQPVQDLQLDSQVTRARYQYSLESSDPEQLATWASRLEQAFERLPQLTNVSSDQRSNGLAVSVAVDRDTAARLGVTAQAVDETLYDAFGQRQVSTVFTQLNQYRIILESAPELREDPRALEKLFVRAANGERLPLSAVARFEDCTTPLVLSHQGQFPSATLSFDLAPGTSLGEAMAAVRQTERQLGKPAAVRADFVGAAQAFREAAVSEPLLLLAAVIIVYIALGVLYESYVHPVTILSSLPSAGVGALLALRACRLEFTIVALIGVILLIGIVKKNAIMMIDFALEAEREQRLSPTDAIYRACLLRFRPIMMTTLAALLGALPLALGSGMGSELRRPLGISIVGGLLVSQVLTLFTTPVVYLYMGRLGRWVTRSFRTEAVPTRPHRSLDAQLESSALIPAPLRPPRHSPPAGE